MQLSLFGRGPDDTVDDTNRFFDEQCAIVLIDEEQRHPPTQQPDPTHIYQPHSDVDDETNRPVTTTKMMTTTNADLHLHLKEKVRRPSVNKEFIKSGHFEVLY